MKLELSIADDRQLRSFIKDLIKGEVRSIARGEIKNILVDVVEEKVIPRTPSEMKVVVQDLVREEVRSVLRSGSYGKPDKIVTITREIVREFLSEMWKEWDGPSV